MLQFVGGEQWEMMNAATAEFTDASWNEEGNVQPLEQQLKRLHKTAQKKKLLTQS